MHSFANHPFLMGPLLLFLLLASGLLCASPVSIWTRAESAWDSLSCLIDWPWLDGDVSSRELGEEGMMYMPVLWDGIVSLGAVVPGYFVPLTEIKTERRGAQNTVKV